MKIWLSEIYFVYLGILINEKCGKEQMIGSGMIY